MFAASFSLKRKIHAFQLITIIVITIITITIISIITIIVIIIVNIVPPSLPPCLPMYKKTLTFAYKETQAR